MTRVAVATLATAATAFALPATANALALSVTTSSPQDVAATRATLRAKVSVSALGANVWWQYGTTTAYGTTSASVSTGLLGVDQTLTVGVAGLTPNTTYHVRAVASSGLSTTYGRDRSFTTANASSGPGSPAPAPTPTDDGSDDDGNGNGSGSTTTPATTATPSPGATASGPQTTSRTPTATPAGDTPAGAIPSEDASTGTPGDATAGLTPVLGKTLGAAAVHGTVTVTSPSGQPIDLNAARSIPNGTLIDTRAGTVELKTALDRKGTMQTGHFWGGLFEVRQSATARGLTQLVLRGGDFSGCAGAARAVARAAAAKATKKKSPPPSLWGSDDHGRFQTRGRGSVATVRGTHWLTQDTCAGTLTRVVAGAVAVHDLRRNRTVVVTRGHEYLARMTP